MLQITQHSLKASLNPRSLTTLYLQKAWFPRQRRFPDDWNDDGGLMPEENVVDEIEYRLSHSDASLAREVLELDKKHEKQVKYKILQRKDFKEQQEVNLLTWDAKCQLRYLLKEFPETWSIDKMVESFPVSRKGVIRLLQSNWVPRNEQELYKHDRRVKKNWIALKEGEPGGPVSLLYQQLASEGKWNLICNAAGIPHLPKPESRLLLSGQTHEVEKPIGKFERIVNDYCEQKKLQASKEMKNKKIENSASQNIHVSANCVIRNTSNEREVDNLLESVANIWRKRLGVELTASERERAGRFISNINADFRKDSISRNSTFKYELKTDDSRINDKVGEIKDSRNHETNNSVSSKILKQNLKQTFEQKINYTSEFSSKDKNLATEPEVVLEIAQNDSEADDKSTDNPETRVIRGRKVRSKTNRSRLNIIPEVLVSEPQLYAMKGTEKISHSKCMQLETPKDCIEEAADNSKWNLIGIENDNMYQNTNLKTSSNIKYSQTVMADGAEAYIYDERTGYQFPYGKQDPTDQHINIPKDKMKKGALHQKGNAFYNEDGEFLYKIP